MSKDYEAIEKQFADDERFFKQKYEEIRGIYARLLVSSEDLEALPQFSECHSLYLDILKDISESSKVESVLSEASRTFCVTLEAKRRERVLCNDVLNHIEKQAALARERRMMSQEELHSRMHVQLEVENTIGILRRAIKDTRQEIKAILINKSKHSSKVENALMTQQDTASRLKMKINEMKRLKKESEMKGYELDKEYRWLQEQIETLTAVLENEIKKLTDIKENENDIKQRLEHCRKEFEEQKLEYEENQRKSQKFSRDIGNLSFQLKSNTQLIKVEEEAINALNSKHQENLREIAAIKKKLNKLKNQYVCELFLMRKYFNKIKIYQLIRRTKRQFKKDHEGYLERYEEEIKHKFELIFGVIEDGREKHKQGPANPPLNSKKNKKRSRSTKTNQENRGKTEILPLKKILEVEEEKYSEVVAETKESQPKIDISAIDNKSVYPLFTEVKGEISKPSQIRRRNQVHDLDRVYLH